MFYISKFRLCWISNLAQRLNYHTIANYTYSNLWNTMRLIGDPLQRISLSIGSQIELEKSCHNSNTCRQRNCEPPSLVVPLGVAFCLLLKTGAKDVAPDTARCSRVGHNCPIKCMSTWLKSSNTNFFKFDPTLSADNYAYITPNLKNYHKFWNP